MKDDVEKEIAKENEKKNYTERRQQKNTYDEVKKMKKICLRQLN